MKFFDEVGLKGKWRMAETDGPDFSGEINLQTEFGSTLKLAGGFNDPLVFPSKRIKHDSMWGIGFDARKVTLVDCVIEDQSSLDRLIHETVYNFRYAFFGPIYFYPKATKFIALKMTATGLEEWLDAKLVELVDEKQVTYKSFPKKSFNVPAVGYVEICSSMDLSHNQTSAHIQAIVGIEVKFNEPYGLVEAEARWTGIESFIEILCGSRCHVLDLQLQEQHSQEWLSVITQPRYPVKPISNHFDVLLPFKDIESNFVKIFEKWDQVSGDLFDELELYERSTRRRVKYSSFDFLAMTQILEGMHRKQNLKAVYMDKQKYKDEVYEPIVKLFPSILDADHRNSIKNRLKYGNEVSLRRRITDLVKSLSPVQQKWIHNDIDTFVSSIVNERNALTHFSDEDTDGFRPANQYVAFDKLRLLFEIYLFRLIGITDEIIEKRFPRDLVRGNILSWKFVAKEHKAVDPDLA